MKKVFSILLVFALLFSSSAFAASIDFSAMSVEELHDIIAEARNELVKKAAKSDDKVFIVDDPEGFSIYLTGKTEIDWMGYYALEVVVINNTNTTQSLSFDNISINGWEVSTIMSGVTDIGAGKKKKDTISLDTASADISSYTEITDVELVFHLYDSETYRTTKSYKAVTLYFDGTNWTKK